MKIFQPKLVMIDVDGTLVDSVPDLAYCVDQMMISLGRPARGEERVRHWVGNGVPRLVERALTGELDGFPSQQAFDKAYPIFLDLYAQNSSVRSTLYEGVIEGLDYLKSKGYLLGCVTNKAEQFTLPLLKSLGIIDYFGIVISGDTLEKKKPDPLPLIHGANFFNINPNECLMLGDSVSDVKAARAASFQIICMSYGYNHGNNIADENPDLVIDSMKQLRDYL
ncbi:MAG: phosphoglycolate phosphatase [Thiotrichales bacterium]|jgi:phosphoglycolate phosphatase|nr:phosphoglycolate phosphatase [Thiotrichales bacterium]MDP6163727.1 phosphoglycolate phosphatase [Candidatus Thioglobus sp.]